MAAVTLLGAATFNTTSGSKTVTATPAAGDLIVIIVGHSGSTASVAPTDDNASGTYSLINTAAKAASADTLQVYVRTALIGSAVSTIFTHAPGTTTGGGLVVLKITGMDKTGAAAVVRSGIQSNQAAAGTPAPALGAVPALANAIITAVFNATNPAGVTVRSGYTSQGNLGYNNPATGLGIATRDSGETSGTITWGGTSASAFASVALELDARNSHASSGVLTGAASTVAGSASRAAPAVSHDASGVLANAGASTSGSASRFRQFDGTGALSGAGAAAAGTGSRYRAFASSGALAGAASVLSGAAARTRQHDSTGALAGQGGAVAGTAAHIARHESTGALSGAGAVATGTGSRYRAFASSGALAGPASELSGAAARTRQHDSTGALAGQGAVLAGAAARLGAAVDHAAVGALSGQGAQLAGAAARVRQFAASGDLSGAASAISGGSARSQNAQLYPTDTAYYQKNAAKVLNGSITGPGDSVMVRIGARRRR